MIVTIWHNPRCSKSRETLELLRSKGVEPVIREYLKDPPTKAEVEKLIRDCPSQYLWGYNRYKRPSGAPPAPVTR